MPTREEHKLFSELKRKGVVVSPELLKSKADDIYPLEGPRNTYPFDSKTTSVQPTSDDGHVQPRVDYAGGTSSGRGNDPARSGGARMPPPIAGLQLPMPGQITGSNEPGSSIRQALPALQQYPSQVVTIPTSVFTSSKDAVPVPTPLKEKSWVDNSHAPASASPLQQYIPSSFQTGSTILQTPRPTPSDSNTRYPGIDDFNKQVPLQPKPDASDSSGVQKPDEFPPGFLSAGVLKQRVRSQVVESNEGE